MPGSGRWQRFSAAALRFFHAYAGWLVGISWRRFIVLAVLLMLVSAVLQNIPPFSWSWTHTVAVDADLPDVKIETPSIPLPPVPARPARPASAPQAPAEPKPAIRIEKPASGSKTGGVEITIDEQGIRVVPKPKAAQNQAQAQAPAGSASAPADGKPLVDIRLPPGANEAVREAVRNAQQDIEDAVREAQAEADAARAEAEVMRDAANEAARQAAEQATREANRALADIRRRAPRHEVHQVSLGEYLPSLAFLWIIASLVIKITYKRQIQAEAQAAQAVETAEAESLRRQVVEARMAAMQAQIEPHFLFNTLASIDHLIEVDPQRASQMQKNLIALLRASMPTMRETGRMDGNGSGRDLGRELAVIRPYLEILKVRMEERLTTAIDVPDGLLSAEFPAMMVQTLVENAIKHGLEPKPEGGHLSVKAEIVHGKLAITVADTGLGFGRAATAGTGVGLANIRERLQLLYGARGSLTITENPGGGTRVTISVPYKPLGNAGEAA
ncbi:MAG: sensor histidine kinase [Burkholderiaceae bacterium]|nr:sensor histidine kinase [Burkholderiaceae bacterium]